MKRSFAAAVSALLLLAHPVSAAGRAYRVRSFASLVFEGSKGEVERTTGGGFSLLSVTGGYSSDVRVSELRDTGQSTVWTIPASDESVFPFAVLSAAQGVSRRIWVLGYRQSAGDSSYLYALDPGTLSVERHLVPFRATRMTFVTGAGGAADPVLSGAGMVARLDATTRVLTTFEVPGYANGASPADASERIFLEGESGALLAFTPGTRRLERWSDFAGVSSRIALDDEGDVFISRGLSGQLARFRPATRQRTVYPIPLSQYPAEGGWIGLAVSDGTIGIASYLGPYFLAADAATLSGGTTATLAVPEISTLTGSSATPARSVLTATVATAAIETTERVVYAESDGGRHLYAVSGSPFNAMLAARDGEFFTGSGPIQWWRPLAAEESFTTESALPVAVEVRPTDPTNNFLTEVTLANVDADSSIALTLKTASAEFTVPLTLAAGGTRVFPNVIQALRELGAAIPGGDATTAGTLTARFSNGRGTLQARVYTKFADATKYPVGSTTGLAFGSVDPTVEPFVFRRTLNGLKNTDRYRTNIAAANLCGLSGACPNLELSASFFDDATGQPVGTVSFLVPPHEWRQADAPLASFPNATGETFSVILQPFQVGPTAYDAYATVIDSQAQDAAFIRAASSGAASVLTVPVVTDRCGATCFTSELALTNTTGSDATADATYTSVTGTEVKEVVTLGNGRGLFWPSAVHHFRLLDPTKVPPGDYGSLRIAFRAYASGFASSRTTAANGTGLGFTAVDPYNARGRRAKRIVGMKESPAFRSNLAVVHLGATTNDAAATVTLRLSLTDATGVAVGTPQTKTLQPGEFYQWNRVLASAFGVTGEGYVATIERTDGLDGFEAYATVIDEVTNDPTFVRAE